MPLTDDEIQAIAWLTARCRPHGAPRWDPPGIAAQLRKVANRPLSSVMRACAAAAADRNNRTPGIITQPGAHWHEDADTPFVAPSLAALCRDCGREQGPYHPDDHPWVSLRGPAAEPGYQSDAALEARRLARQAKAGVASTPAPEAGSAT